MDHYPRSQNELPTFIELVSLTVIYVRFFQSGIFREYNALKICRTHWTTDAVDDIDILMHKTSWLKERKTKVCIYLK